MALLNVSMCSKFSAKPLLLRPHPSISASRSPLALPLKRQPEASQKLALSLTESVSTASLVALFSVSLFFADPALAFKGGGPYGQEVTRGQDLTGKDFSGKTLIKQDFKTSILRQANFKGAKLLGASFFDADLTGADLSDADLRGADFSLANVTKANLSNANLEGALATGNTSFKGTNITGADFTDVPLRDDQREYLCKVADGVNPTTGNSTRETLLCN
ncbi:thylakoid lumenal 15 kDa protein 1, chloroplastic [Prosopis cineraria]|uniref:thylakoid lumenal 15 kDa protein 1, chloroplastic n=1 Tax=Prosopis cineraria TaxID=364024 RepID=UPI002410635C|nr:thylakoid lumenal 15 kDa protein 1, chloroplastic [Prosopis cineraria]